MKKLLNLLLIVSTAASGQTNADKPTQGWHVLSITPLGASAEGCDWKTGITQIDANHYSYSLACHLKVGTLVKEAPFKDSQIADLKKAITLQDLALKKSDENTQQWMNAAMNIQDKVQTYERNSELDSWLKFGLGIAVTSFAVWGAGYLKH